MHICLKFHDAVILTAYSAVIVTRFVYPKNVAKPKLYCRQLTHKTGVLSSEM